jgi:VanZ family protein
LINIALYVPFGMSAFSLFRRYRRTVLAWIGPVFLGAALSCCIEMIQLFEPTRHCSALDVLCNMLGATLGTFAGWLFEELSAIRSTGTRANPVRTLAFVDRAALALLFCWVAYLVFPFFPVLGRTMTRQKIAIFFHTGFSPLAMASAAACWFIGGRLLRTAGIRPAYVWLAIAVLAIPAQILIVFRQPVFAELLGAAVGFTLFVLWNKRIPPNLTAVSFLLLLIVRGLAPFHFEANPIAFSWLPFGGFLAMDWRPGMVVLLEKLFYYGAAVWLLRAAGIRLLWTAPMVAIVLAAIEAAQVWVPGRTAEITDPLLALLMGAVLGACQPKAHPRGAVPVEVLP